MKANWNLIFRRTHLYLGMALLPWMMVYALSTFVFNHRDTFQKYRQSEVDWQRLWEKDYAVEIPAGGDALKATAQRIIADNGLSGGFFAARQGQRVNIHVQNFWQPVRLTYDVEKKKLTAEQRPFAWLELLARLHYRVGYGQPGLLNTLWAVIVDLFCVTLLVWIATGLYLWWKLPDTRRWGYAAIGGGVLSILILLGTL